MLLETIPSREEFRSLLGGSSVVPVGVRILADTETPVSLLARFAPHSPHLFLLESAEGGESCPNQNEPPRTVIMSVYIISALALLHYRGGGHAYEHKYVEDEYYLSYHC